MTTHDHLLTRRQAVGALLAGATLPLAAQPSGTAPLLNKTVTITNGFPAGGSSDVTGRLIAERLRDKLAPMVLVENRPGAGGRIAVDHVKSQPADGSSLLLTPQGMMALFPHICRKLPYDPQKDFVPVTMVVKFPFVLTISSLVPAEVKTLEQFLAWCRKEPASSSFGSPGEGTSAHFAGVMLGQSAGVKLTHVPYRGMAPLVQDLLGGQIASGVLTSADAAPLLASGKLRAIAVTAPNRSMYLPDVPTLTELGHPTIQIEEMYGLFAPAATPAPVVERIASLVRETLGIAEIKARFAQLYLEPVGNTPAQFDTFMRTQHQRWGAIVKATNFVPNE